MPHVVGQLEQMVLQQGKQYLSMADESVADTDTEIDDSPQESIKARSSKPASKKMYDMYVLANNTSGVSNLSQSA